MRVRACICVCCVCAYVCACVVRCVLVFLFGVSESGLDPLEIEGTAAYLGRHEKNTGMCVCVHVRACVCTCMCVLLSHNNI